MIVTLAGHVDHGKTSLVRSLSGVDTDRLAEEKARGLTIDLGFAYIDDGKIGFVDVPGHHRFIHNMVAGIAANQYALLVIAADDGPMPQSREHLDILQLIGVNRGCIALTKVDRVDSEQIASVRDSIAALTSETFLRDAPVFETSTESVETTERLLDHLRVQADADSTSALDRPFRLAIDRKFNVRGAGLVVTGTIHNGSVTEGDQLFHFPSNRPVRVRGIHAQDQPVKSAGPSERCALNLTGLDADEVARGHWLSQDVQPAVREVTLQLEVLRNFPRSVRHWTPVHVYHATSHTTGKIALLSNKRVQPGDTELVDVVLDEPLVVNRGDRIVLRDYGLDTTLGGGDVVYASPEPTHRRRSESRLTRLEAYACDDPVTSLGALLDAGPCSISEFQRVWALQEKDMDSVLAEYATHTVNDQLMLSSTWEAMSESLTRQMEEHQNANPSSPGLRENQFAGIPVAFRSAALSALVQAGKMTNQNGIYRGQTHEAELPAQLERLWDKLQPKLDQLQAPSSGDLAKLWGVQLGQLERDLIQLSKRGYLVHIANHRFYLPAKLEEIADIVLSLGAPFSVKQFRDTTGIGRNVAIEILEYFDSRGFTRRQGNERILLKDTL